jgi:hypothetical protein
MHTVRGGGWGSSVQQVCNSVSGLCKATAARVSCISSQQAAASSAEAVAHEKKTHSIEYSNCVKEGAVLQCIA